MVKTEERGDIKLENKLCHTIFWPVLLLIIY